MFLGRLCLGRFLHLRATLAMGATEAHSQRQAVDPEALLPNDIHHTMAILRDRQRGNGTRADRRPSTSRKREHHPARKGPGDGKSLRPGPGRILSWPGRSRLGAIASAPGRLYDLTMRGSRDSRVSIQRRRPYEVLEPYDGKLSCTVLRGAGAG